MMTDKRTLISGVFVLCLVNVRLAATTSEPSISELTKAADAILIIKLTETLPELNTAMIRAGGRVVAATVLDRTVGDEKQKHIQIVYPGPHFEAMLGHVPPVQGTLLLAFLKKRSDGMYVAATLLYVSRSLGKDGRIVERQVLEPVGGNECLRKIDTESDVPKVKALMSEFLRWEDLDAKRRPALLRDMLLGPNVMRHIALEWITIDRAINFHDSSAPLIDPIIEGIVVNLDHRDTQLRQRAFRALRDAAVFRDDLIPYVVGALDDPERKKAAVWFFKSRRGGRPGPTLDTQLPDDEGATRLKQWWAEEGSRDPRFKRFVPSLAIPATRPTNGSASHPERKKGE